jgi:hypothetical protein
MRRFSGEKGSIRRGFSLRRRKEPKPFPPRVVRRIESGIGSTPVFLLDRFTRRSRLKNPFMVLIITHLPRGKEITIRSPPHVVARSLFLI